MNKKEEIKKSYCQLCGEPMPEGEEMFNYHGYSGNCPKPPLSTKIIKKEEVNKKEGAISYVLVVDVSDNVQLYYYCGYYKNGVSINSVDYTKAMKIPFKDEAEYICSKINEQKNQCQYHVEEHMYM